MGEANEKCAVFGAFDVPDAASTAAIALAAMQHRGQEATGIAVAQHSYRTLNGFGGAGLVVEAYDFEELSHVGGHVAVGHNRYATSGGRGGAHPQPVRENWDTMAFAHNGNLPRTRLLENFLSDRDIDTLLLNDSEMMSRAIGYFAARGANLSDAVVEAYSQFTGAFSIVAMTSDRLVAARDAFGIRPLSLGRLAGGFVVASETCAFDAIGATYERDINPGEVLTIDKDGPRSLQAGENPTHKLDIFEPVYFASPESILLGQRVGDMRERFGEELAWAHPTGADIVVPVPSSAIPAALGYARISGIPFEKGLVRDPSYVKRTFIEPTPAAREAGVRRKLQPQEAILKGKSIALIEDSIVRGTTLRAIIGVLRNAQAAEIHVRIASPPVMYPDYYGIDLPHRGDLVAARMSVEATCRYLGADSLAYLPFDSMIRTTGLPASMFTTSCFSGEYPLPVGEELLAAAHASCV